MKHATGNDETRHRQCPHFCWLHKTLKFAYENISNERGNVSVSTVKTEVHCNLCRVLLVFLPCVYENYDR